MPDSERSRFQIGYCTNVHPGRDLEEVRQQLAAVAVDVRQRVRPNSIMGLGLWLSDQASRDLSEGSRLGQFRDFLIRHGLDAFTFNGFPFSDFHQETVKHRVYVPTWAESVRLEYTVRLAKILCAIQHPDHETDRRKLTISTLPLGWPGDDKDDSFFRECALNVIRCAWQLAELREQTGMTVQVCLEPEPGCLLDTADDVVNFFEQYLRPLAGGDKEHVANHIGVCHDICHSSVMFEPQHQVLMTYREHGIRLGKIQVSNALACIRDVSTTEMEWASRLDSLAEFAEPRYLHQTMIRERDGDLFFADLPDALFHERERSMTGSPAQTWRVHFHVPLFCSSVGELQTTQSDILDCLRALGYDAASDTQFELETYAWSVIPVWCRRPLAEGLAEEFRWFDRTLSEVYADCAGNSAVEEK